MSSNKHWVTCVWLGDLGSDLLSHLDDVQVMTVWAMTSMAWWPERVEESRRGGQVLRGMALRTCLIYCTEPHQCKYMHVYGMIIAQAEIVRCQVDDVSLGMCHVITTNLPRSHSGAFLSCDDLSAVASWLFLVNTINVTSTKCHNKKRYKL